jgi:hypothetical protein
MIGAILGGLSAVASGISAIQNFQQAQQAQKSANMFGQQLQGIKETNALLGLKSPDISGLQAQQTAAQTAQAIQAVQSPEGAAQVANIYQAGLQQNAENMQRQAEADFQTDLAKRQNEQQVQYRNISAERALAGSRLEGAQTAASEFKTRANENLTAGLTGLGKAIGTYATGAALDYGAKAARIQALVDGGMKLEDAIKKEEENNQ